MINKSKISVVCPTFNSGAFVTRTLNSVIQQTKYPFELIVIDDGSTDDTIFKVKECFKNCIGFETTLIQNPHLGPGASRNVGILQARGEWVAFLDSDDLWYPNKIFLLAEVIENNSKVNFIFHNEDRIKLDGTKSILHDFGVFYKRSESLNLQVWRYCIFHTSAVACKKEVLLEVGLFDERLMSSQDWDLWIRLSPYIRFHFISDILGTYIDRPQNITSTKSFSGLVDRLKIMSVHWSSSGAGIGEYAYRVVRRIGAFVLAEAKIRASKLKSD